MGLPRHIEEGDEIVSVSLPLKDYQVMRELIAERQAMRGLKRWLTHGILWILSSIVAFVGAFEVLRRLGE